MNSIEPAALGAFIDSNSTSLIAASFALSLDCWLDTRQIFGAGDFSVDSADVEALRDICECLASLLARPGLSNDHRIASHDLTTRPPKQQEFLKLWLDGDAGTGLIALTGIVSSHGLNLKSSTMISLAEAMRGA